MTVEKDKTLRPATSVGFRLSLVLGLALLPLFALAVAQNRSLSRQAIAQLDGSLLGQAVSTAQPEIDAIRSARVTARAMAQAMPEVIDDTDACIALARRIEQSDPRVSVAGFLPGDGRMVCSSFGVPYDFSSMPNFRTLRQNPSANLTVSQRGVLSKEPVITASHPLFAADGSFQGWAFVSIPHRLIPRTGDGAGARPAAGTTARPTFLTFDANGTILTSSTGLDHAGELVPEGMTLAGLARQSSRTFTANPPGGPVRTYVVVPLAEGSLYLLGTWSGDRLQGVGQLSQVGYLLPVLIWLTCILCARLISHHSVTRHIGAMRTAMRRFAGGRRTLTPLNLESAPAEIRDLGVSFTDMAGRLLQDEAELENMVHQRDLLLREVHHRVKNNLQLMASMMNLQIRHAQSEETMDMMRAVQERVMNLAFIHRELYLTTGEMEVRARELLEQMVSRVARLGRTAERGIAVTTDFEDLTVTPDQAIAMSLVVNETLTTALGRGGPAVGGAGQGPISRVIMSLRRTRPGAPNAPPAGAGATGNVGDEPEREPGDLVVLEIVLGAPPGRPPPDGPDGLSSMLILSFARQLGSDAVRETVGSDFRLSITFRLASSDIKGQGRAAAPFALSERSPPRRDPDGPAPSAG